jgi:hypothetical protein
MNTTFDTNSMPNVKKNAKIKIKLNGTLRMEIECYRIACDCGGQSQPRADGWLLDEGPENSAGRSENLPFGN